MKIFFDHKHLIIFVIKRKETIGVNKVFFTHYILYTHSLYFYSKQLKNFSIPLKAILFLIVIMQLMEKGKKNQFLKFLRNYYLL